MNVLVTCGSSIIMAEVVTLLRQIESIESILLVDAEKIYIDHGCQTVLVPYGRSPNYSDAILDLINKHNIEFIYVGSDDEALSLCSYDWVQSHSHLDSKENIELILDKYKLHKKLYQDYQNLNLTPLFQFCNSYKDLQKMVDQNGSVISRPVRGRGSRELQHIISPNMQDQFPRGIPLDKVKFPQEKNQIFYAEYLSGDKFSADCIFSNGELITCMIRNNGPTVKYRPPTILAQTSNDPKVFLFATQIGSALSLNGFHQIECGKAINGDIRLIEINPRLDATLPITKCYSHNFYELLLYRKSVGLMEPKKQIFRRYFKGYSC